MATIKVRIFVTELSNVMLEFNRIKVYRCATKTGTYAEITTAGTRPVLTAGQTVYEYIDTTAPTPNYWYCTSYYSTVSLLESSLSVPIQGLDAGLYVSIQDIRDEGVSLTELSDERALLLIRGWQEWFEKMTGQFFTQRQLSMDLDGEGSRVLRLPIFCIQCDELYVNGDFTTPLDTSLYVLYNSYGFPTDDRRNPRIKIIRENADIFTTPNKFVFETGDRNQRVVGTFGHVNEDGSTPFPVKRAITILVMMSKDLLSDSELDVFHTGRVVEEVTDRHRVRYSDLYDKLNAWNPTGIAEVDNAIALYRRPMGIEMPRSFQTV